MKYKTIRGTRDILPDESSGWQRIEDISRNIFKKCGYREIRTPVMEETALFIKSVGEDTDIVNKEMFSFEDRGGRNISLRPEGTAPIVRAYLENNLYKTDPFQKLYYIGPMFRAERPQAGRMRQFYQIGLEAIGSTSPAVDAEVIKIAMRILEDSDIKGCQLKINNLGCSKDKEELKKILKKTFSDKGTAEILCEDCKRRLKTNPLRVLDCKNENCRAIVKGSFKKAEFLCGDCKDHFNKVLGFLDSLKIPYDVDNHIVRGLDYYTRTVFEITQRDLGAQDAIGAGGRYDNLISDMGGPALGACGFALGLDRMILAWGRKTGGDLKKHGADVFVATIGESPYSKAFVIANVLRDAGISCEMDYEGKSLKSQMRTADALGVRFVLIIGDDELRQNKVLIKDMAKKDDQVPVDTDHIIEEVRKRIC
ncbi:MAG: histidine--tRNA ligase [Candidatus Omnitrophota bacterium]